MQLVVALEVGLMAVHVESCTLKLPPSHVAYVWLGTNLPHPNNLDQHSIVYSNESIKGMTIDLKSGSRRGRITRNLGIYDLLDEKK